MATNAVALVAAASYAAQPTRHYSKDVLRTSCLNKTPHDAIRSHWLSVHLQARLVHALHLLLHEHRQLVMYSSTGAEIHHE